MPDQNSSSSHDNTAVAKSAGLAFLGRLGALVELLSLGIITYLYDQDVVGLYFAMWSTLRVTSSLSEFAMTTGLQRFIPAAADEVEANTIIKTAFTIILGLGFTLAAIASFFAPELAKLFNASEETSAHIVTMVRIYVWVLPFWTMVEVLTASVRAQRTFGPEIRVRIFYEQGIRLVWASGLFFAGFELLGLFVAHLLSVIMAATLAFKLSMRFYDYKTILRTPYNAVVFKKMVSFCVLMAPANMTKRLNSELPVMLLNFMLPGTIGAHAAAAYGLGRRISSALQTIRQSYEYVVAPYATLSGARGEHRGLAEMYAFSTRMIACLTLPFAMVLILIRFDLLDIFKPGYEIAAGVILFLSIGRIVEGFGGPSSTLVEMLQHRSLPLINGVAGIASLVAIQLWLMPQYGASGAAIAAAVGFNVTGYMAVLQVRLIRGIWPITKDFLRPFAVAFFGTSFAGYLFSLANDYGQAEGLIVAGLGIFLSLVLLVRFGFRPSDVQALGRLGKALGGGKKARAVK